MSAQPSSAAREWVLHTPYREPDRHWALDQRGRAMPQINAGRRPSSTQLPVPRPQGGPQDWKTPDENIEPHGTINRIRTHVAAWREAGWPAVPARIAKLLGYWAREEAEMRPFWCQREAVETLVWLFDAGRRHSPSEHAAIKKILREANGSWNEGIPRVAMKMATGTGKTLLMAMIALWWTARRPGQTVEFLALTPGLTIRDHLQVLADKRAKLWKSVAPKGFQSDLERMRWTILNFQSFQRQSKLMVGGKKATRKEIDLLIGRGGKKPASWTESEKEMLGRLLREHSGGRIAVINDEAHHCYTYRGVKRRKGREDADEREDRKRAELWFGALRALRRSDLLGQVFDLSATPMWLRRPQELKAETFPWTVSDFSLLDAVESGLVKVPRVPVDETSIEDGQPAHQHPRYRSIYLHNDRRDIGEPLAPKVREPLNLLYAHYLETNRAWAKRGKIPVMIVVANSIKNATMLHRYIAGYQEGEVWKPGNLELFSNSDKATGRPKERPPTVLVHSQLDDIENPKGKIGKAIAEQAGVFAPEAKTLGEKSQAIRDIFMTVGKRGEPGERIRCVISVGMLTEGWDARTVSHVFGYRAFGSQLLCEQVAGRALRKTAFSNADERQSIEYANLFGVPFAFLGGTEVNRPPPAPPDALVETMPGRESLRIRFPNVTSYGSLESPRWEVNVDRLRGHVVKRRRYPVTARFQGILGDYEELVREPAPKNRALWLAAAQLVPRLDGGIDHRRRAFSSSLRIARGCLEVMDCPNWDFLRLDAETLDLIGSQARRAGGPSSVAPVFGDQSDPGSPRATDTSSVRFRTALKNLFPQRRGRTTERSELNVAACHSFSEARLAGILDAHPDIQAWVRNFRLGWQVPWFDPKRPGPALTEPDFIARSRLKTSSGRDRYLVIEFKGMMAGQAREEQKRKYLEEVWAPAVSKAGSGDRDFGDWQAIWIEKIDFAAELIAHACRKREWK